MPVPFSDTRSIPDDELVVRASRSGGAGGQHVNTSSTRIEVLWSPGASRVLSDEEKVRVTAKLVSRIDAAGFIRVVSSDTRSQLQNRERAGQRLGEMLRQALIVAKRRKATKPSKASRQARLDEKRATSRRKSERRRKDWE